jgi:hypothetical protein
MEAQESMLVSTFQIVSSSIFHQCFRKYLSRMYNHASVRLHILHKDCSQ